MSEKFKSRFEVDVDTSKRVSIRLNGRVSKKGVTSEETDTGKKYALFYVSVTNQTERLMNALDIPKDILMINTSDYGDEYLTIPVRYYGFAAERSLEHIHAGDIVEVCLNAYVTEKDGKKYVNFRSMWSPVIVKSNETSASEPETNTSEPTVTQSSTDFSEFEESGDSLDLEGDMLPF